MRNFFFIFAFFTLFFVITNSFSRESKHLSEGIKYFNKQEFDKSKIFFEIDLVFNPKSEASYLYIAKIFQTYFRYPHLPQSFPGVVIE